MPEYYMLNKPRGTLTANRDARRQTVFSCFPPGAEERLFAMGRLDFDTEGLLLITDDGQLCARLMHPHSHIEKTYFFYAIGCMTPEKVSALETGLSIDDGRTVTAPASFSLREVGKLRDILPFLDEKEAKRAKKHLDTPIFSATLTITEGKKNQVKRMLRAVNCHIVYLQRLRIGALPLDSALRPGEYRSLREDEVAALYAQVSAPEEQRKTAFPVE